MVLSSLVQSIGWMYMFASYMKTVAPPNPYRTRSVASTPAASLRPVRHWPDAQIPGTNT
jgi:hypothetical protein